MRSALVVVWLGVSACGRIGFDEQSSPVLATELRLIAGATSIDVEVCVSRSARVRTVVSTVPWPAGWDTAYLETTLVSRLPEVVGMADELTSQAGCTTTTYVITAPDATLHVYAVTDVESSAEVALGEATAMLHPMLEPVAFPVAAGHTQRYWIHYPESYYRDPSAPLPVLVFLSGGGEDGDDAGTNLDLLPNRGMLSPFTQRRDAILDLPFLVIAPQCNTDRASCWGWINHGSNIDEVVEHARATATLDEERIYATGLSTGGEGALRYAIHTRTRAAGEPGVVVAAAVAIASTFTDAPFYMGNMCSIASVPLWAFHNTDDPTQSVTNSRTFVSMLNGCSPQVPAQLDEGTGGHNAWSRVYNDTHSYTNGGATSIYTWLLAYTR